VFIDEYLEQLRRERFTPAAITRYVHKVAARSREAAIANPGAVRSVWLVALLYFGLAFAGSALLALEVDRRFALDVFVATTLAILPSFLLVTASLDFLRDQNGYRLSAINVPIALTLLRPVLMPAVVLSLVDHRLVLAAVLYLAAGLTDVVDGWIARRTGQVTRLGTVLDPIVDIVFNLAVILGLGAAGFLPVWVLIAGAVRYGLLLVGGAGLWLFAGPLRIQPTWFGRMTGVGMSFLIALLTLLHAVGGHLEARLAPLTEIALGVLLIATVAQAVLLGWYNLRVMGQRPEGQGRVVGDVRWGAQ
jgi:cardiolipin synthase